MITLLSEALCFTTYLSLYLHRIFKFYYFFFLTFIFSVDQCFWGKHTFGYLLMKALKLSKFGIGVVFWQVHTGAKFHWSSSTVTLFPGGGRGGGIHTPSHRKPKKPGLNRVKFEFW